jgi:hypothetical protein
MRQLARELASRGRFRVSVTAFEHLRQHHQNEKNIAFISSGPSPFTTEEDDEIAFKVFFSTIPSNFNHPHCPIQIAQAANLLEVISILSNYSTLATTATATSLVNKFKDDLPNLPQYIVLFFASFFLFKVNRL